jgi:hypothetical protein
MDKGWIKLHRSFLKWEWSNDYKMVSLFIHLLLKANHKPKRWQGMVIGRGQLLTGRKQLSQDTGLSERSIRTCLERLKSTNELTIKTTSKYSLITLVKYDTYQATDTNPDQQNDQQNDQQTTNKRPQTRIKELKNNTHTGNDSPDAGEKPPEPLEPEIEPKPKGNPTYSEFTDVAGHIGLVGRGVSAFRRKKPLIALPADAEERYCLLTAQEMKDLHRDFGSEFLKYWIDSVQQYAQTKQREFAGFCNHAQCIRNWHKLKCEKVRGEWSRDGPRGPGYYAGWELENFINAGANGTQRQQQF